MADNDEKIIKALEALQAGQTRLEKTMNRKLNSIKKDIELVLKYHDEMYIRQEKRIERLEEHTGFTPDKN